MIGEWKLFYSGPDPTMSAEVSLEILTSPRLSDHRLFISRLETDSFFYGVFVLEYANFSNQRYFFLHGLLVLQIRSISRIRVTAKKTLQQEQISSMLFSFSSHVCFWSTK